MARDFAQKGGRSGGGAAARSRKNARGPQRAGGLRWYLVGVFTGIFLSFVVYLGTLPPTGIRPAEAPAAAGPDTAGNQPKPRFDFYRILPETSIRVEAEPAEPTASGSAGPTEKYLLQAGSFRQREDADRRRAELLLLGLAPRIEEATGDNGRWYRVYLGPYDSREKMLSARGLTAGQGIDTLLLKRSGP